MTQARVNGIAEENVVMRTQGCSITILPRLGGKIASIRVEDRELLQQPLAACAPRTLSMPFDAGDASGWDECLPSVAACTVEAADWPVAIPDHGDLWRVEWSEVEDHRSDPGRSASAALRAECFSLPLTLERTVALAETGKGWRLSLDYTLTNTGEYPVPWSWSAHPLFSAEAGDRIVLPDSIHELRLEGSSGGRLGRNGDRVSWPTARMFRGGETDLSVVLPPESGFGDKLFTGRLSAAENWCTLERPRAGVRVKIGLDPAATPYLGLWLCYGGWPERPGPKQMCIGLEPATAPRDSLAQAGPWSRVLSPRESFSWPMVVDFEVL